MQQVFTRAQARPLWQDLTWALAFALITAASARLSVELGGPVPFTFQTLAVLLAGLVLGARGGVTSQALYVGAVALGAPLDARGLGTLALFGPTGGYLVGFVLAAFVAGVLSGRVGGLAGLLLGGVGGVAALYACGLLWLRLWSGLEWAQVWAAGAAPFVLYDGVKVLLAVVLVRGLPRRA